MAEERVEVKILGRLLGTATGWDGDPGECMWFYDFQPSVGVHLPSGDLQFCEERGLLGLQSAETGEIIEPVDAVTFLSQLQRSEKI